LSASCGADHAQYKDPGALQELRQIRSDRNEDINVRMRAVKAMAAMDDNSGRIDAMETLLAGTTASDVTGPVLSLSGPG